MLSGGKTKRSRYGKIPVYEFKKEGEDWKVIGLRGHIINLDFPREYNNWNNISPKDLIEIEPVKKVSNKGIGNALKKLVNENPFLIVATDYDREGELIGVEVLDLLKKYNEGLSDIKRAKFSAITAYEIKKAFGDLSEVDYNLSSAGETRQVIDLIWGAVLTRFISLTAKRFGKDFLSIGRVQSPTLAILVEREKEIQKFVPKPYWKIIADLNKDEKFKAEHVKGQFWDEKEVQTIYDKVKKSKTAKVLKVDKKENKEYPPSPFNTTTFLQSASYLRISASRAMSIAEELYMSGLISYPRTDNTVYPGSLSIKKILNKLSNSDFSKETKFALDNKRPYPTRGKKKTTDHPPIHPVDVPKKKFSSTSHEKIYELIVRRFLATLTKDAISETVDASFDISGEEFKSKGYRLIEANWRKIYPYFKERRKPIPDISEGEEIDVSKIILKKDETKPPKRYNQGSLIAKMESLSLGTKSTRHEIINKLRYRRYITLSPLAPTPLGIAVIDALSDFEVVKPRMTATLEEDMDKISEGKKTLDETVKESREMLTKVVVDLEKEKEKIRSNIQDAHKEQSTIGKCPKCGKDLVIRRSKRGKRFVGCSGYPDCKNTYSLPQRGKVVTTDKNCEKCGSPIVKIINKGKRPWTICLNIDCKK